MNIEVSAGPTEVPPVKAPPMRRKRVRKTKLRTLTDLDRRSVAYRKTLEVIKAIIVDLGGDPPMTVQQIIQAGALLGAMREDLGTRWLAGEPIDQALYATLCNAERRQYETAGLSRVPRDITTIDTVLTDLAKDETKHSEASATAGGLAAATDAGSAPAAGSSQDYEEGDR
jgi:hypothetical protein